MTKYVFFNFPASGHVNPTLAIVEELVARGEEIVYYLPEPLRPLIEATGATFRAYPFELFSGGQPPAFSPADANKRLAMLPVYMIQQSAQKLPYLLETVRAEQADCIVYDSMFLWARFVAQILHIPAVGLRPSYAVSPTYAANTPNPFARFAQSSPQSSPGMASLNDELAQLSSTYGLPLLDMHSVLMYAEPLMIVFLPRAFQPFGETFDERFLFVGPSLQSHRHEPNPFPLQTLGEQPRLYISLGTVFNNQADFYNLCFAAFADTEWQVILSTGRQVDQSLLDVAPQNFIVVPHVSQLEVLPRTDIFISHGGMNSTMESLYYGVPLIIIPQINEQAVTAQRVQELGLGIALDRASVTAQMLHDAVDQIAHDPSFRSRVQAMQQQVRESGGYQRATDALMQYARANAQK